MTVRQQMRGDKTYNILNMETLKTKSTRSKPRNKPRNKPSKALQSYTDAIDNEIAPTTKTTKNVALNHTQYKHSLLKMLNLSLKAATATVNGKSEQCENAANVGIEIMNKRDDYVKVTLYSTLKQ